MLDSDGPGTRDVTTPGEFTERTTTGALASSTATVYTVYTVQWL